MECVIKDYILSKFVQGGVLSRNQHAFLRNHSTTTNLLDSTYDWFQSFRNSQCIDVAYIDFSKAFDSIVHSKLLLKLKAYGFDGALLDIIRVFLSNRWQQVSFDGCFSPWVNVVSGVQQGSVLGPILFIIFINDISSICDGQTRCKLFADDLKLYSSVDLQDGHSPSLQCSLDKLYEWSVKWQLPVNAEKCFGIQLSRSRLRSDSCDIARFDYLIGSRVLLSRSCVEDLGVTYDCNLHFDKHIDSIVSAARAKVGLLFRGFKTRDVVILRRAYVTYIRPTLEYASSVWNPYAKKSIYKLEGVQ